jgi:hypothetical protein
MEKKFKRYGYKEWSQIKFGNEEYQILVEESLSKLENLFRNYDTK